MKKRILSILLLLTLLAFSASAAGEQAAVNIEYRDMRFVVNGEAVTPVDSEGNPVWPFIMDGILYLPAGTIPSALGLPMSYDEASDTLYIGERPDISGPHWHLKGTNYELHDGSSNKENYSQEYSFEGETEGYILFRNEGSFSDRPSNSWRRTVYYECAVPPADLREGDQLILPVTISVADAEKGSDVEYFSTGSACIYSDMIKGSKQMTDRNGLSANAAAVPGSIGMAEGDGEWTVTFESEVFGALVPGSTANIEFWCEAGTFIWEYEYIVPEQ